MSDAAALAGAIAGGVESLAVQPLDMIKTRFQLSTSTNPSMLSAFRGLLAEGGLPRLYRGLLPEMVGNVPTRMAMYTGKDFAATVLGSWGLEHKIAVGFISGAFSGLPEAIVTTPFQVVKIRMQNKELTALYQNDLDCFVKVLRAEGPMAFTTGFSPTFARNIVWNSVYFGTIGFFSNLMGPRIPGIVGEIQNFSSGLFGGVFATCFNAPFDVAKSRVQSGGDRYRTTFGTLALIFREEGPRALYRGFVPKAWRMGVGGAVGITTFDLLLRCFR